jgi:hypothetical protein
MNNAPNAEKERCVSSLRAITPLVTVMGRVPVEAECLRASVLRVRQSFGQHAARMPWESGGHSRNVAERPCATTMRNSQPRHQPNASPGPVLCRSWRTLAPSYPLPTPNRRRIFLLIDVHIDIHSQADIAIAGEGLGGKNFFLSPDARPNCKRISPPPGAPHFFPCVPTFRLIC